MPSSDSVRIELLCREIQLMSENCWENLHIVGGQKYQKCEYGSSVRVQEKQTGVVFFLYVLFSYFFREIWFFYLEFGV